MNAAVPIELETSTREPAFVAQAAPQCCVSGFSRADTLHGQKPETQGAGRSLQSGWGARIRTGNGGTKNRCLTMATPQRRGSTRFAEAAQRAPIAPLGAHGESRSYNPPLPPPRRCGKPYRSSAASAPASGAGVACSNHATPTNKKAGRKTGLFTTIGLQARFFASVHSPVTVRGEQHLERVPATNGLMAPSKALSSTASGPTPLSIESAATARRSRRRTARRRPAA